MEQNHQKRTYQAGRKIFTRGLLLGVMLVFGMAVIFSFYHQSIHEVSQAESQTSLKPAPLFQLPDDQGQMHSLDEFKGKWILIHFWATWCPPCLGEIPEWIELRESFPSQAPIQWIAISMDSSWETAHQALPAHPRVQGLISLLDVKARTPEEYGTFNYPETYLLNPDLKIVTKWVGPQKWNAPETIQFFKKLIAQ